MIGPATRDVDLPLGAAALLALPDRSPLIALANDDWSQIDLLKTLLQLQHPRMVVVGAPASPRSVEIRLTAGGDAVPSDLAYEWSAPADAGHAHRRGAATATAPSV
ncbi:MAG: hypothetical protein ACOC2D_13660 [Spirochaetota bacterium]